MKTRETLIHPHDTAADERTETLRKCVRSEETCPKGASEAYFRTVEEPLGQRFAGDGVFYQRFLKLSTTYPLFHRRERHTFRHLTEGQSHSLIVQKRYFSAKSRSCFR